MVAGLFLSTGALADTTLTYHSDGGCTGDFDRVELKAQWLRVDAGASGQSSSMIYDHAEKLAYFVDNRSHSFMQTELDEDAVDLQADIMKSLRTKIRHESGGMDPFEMVKSICPGMAANSRDRQPGEPIDCGNGMTMGGAPMGADGKPMSRDEMAAAMKSGHMPMDAGTQQMMQKMMQEQLAKMPPEQRAQMQQMMVGSGGSMPGFATSGGPNLGGAGAAPAPAPQRIDRDAGDADVGGVVCALREHLRGDEMLREDCYAPATALHLGDAETRRLATIQQVAAGVEPQPRPGRISRRRRTIACWFGACATRAVTKADARPSRSTAALRSPNRASKCPPDTSRWTSASAAREVRERTERAARRALRSVDGSGLPESGSFGKLAARVPTNRFPCPRFSVLRAASLRRSVSCWHSAASHTRRTQRRRAVRSA